MKTSLIFWVLSFLACVFASNTRAQSSATANITATIVTPITIEKVSGKDLSFGNIAVGNSAGIVILNTNGSRQTQGGAILPSTTGIITPAEFLVTGQGAFSFNITLPSTPIMLVHATDNQSMTVDEFTSTPSVTGTLSAGKQTVKIGARLNVKAAQTPGLYSSATPFTVTVNYN